ncbi:MAG: NAD(P)-dependent oxidoreductase [Planctomycetes bacterium]|nr:NAD(P)-dependent oxidoreductase [Planctomycetota bacterium]
MNDCDTSFFKKFTDRVEIITGNITAKESLTDLFSGSDESILFHLAGVIHPTNGVKQFYKVNVDGTLNLLELSRKYDVKKIIIVSSNSQSGCNPDREHLFTEESPYNPYMNYGKSKFLMETGVQKYANMYDLDITIIRACWFYGPHQPARQTEFFRMIRDGKFPIVGDGLNRRSMSYVDNLCQGLLLAAQNPVSHGKKYWIADERPYTMLEIVNTTADVLEQDFGFQVKRKVVRLPNIASNVAYMMDYMFQSLGFYNTKIHVLSELNKDIACSVECAKSELGYSPTVELREGMRRSIKWCLDIGMNI